MYDAALLTWKSLIIPVDFFDKKELVKSVLYTLFFNITDGSGIIPCYKEHMPASFDNSV